MTKRITRTDAEYDHLRFLLPTRSQTTADIITDMEAQGQRELAQSSQLPRDGYDFDRAAELGIKANTVHSDPLFVDVTLPEGFAIKPTEHSMWSDLLDAQGQKVAAIFYKAAFYDRRATMHWE